VDESNLLFIYQHEKPPCEQRQHGELNQEASGFQWKFPSPTPLPRVVLGHCKPLFITFDYMIKKLLYDFSFLLLLGQFKKMTILKNKNLNLVS